jgi:hypothetical protein
VPVFHRNRLRVQSIEVICNSCGEKHRRLVTVQEIQPTRYIFKDYGPIEAKV